jgi:hypothetical protein
MNRQFGNSEPNFEDIDNYPSSEAQEVPDEDPYILAFPDKVTAEEPSNDDSESALINEHIVSRIMNYMMIREWHKGGSKMMILERASRYPALSIIHKYRTALLKRIGEPSPDIAPAFHLLCAAREQIALQLNYAIQERNQPKHQPELKIM